MSNIPGLGWSSGAYVPGSTPSGYAAFASWRGRLLDVVVDWPARQRWSDIVDPAWLYRAWAGTQYTKVFGVAMIPENDGASLESCAQGEYDARWRQFGSNIAMAGLAASTIIRLGWEFNTDNFVWAARDPDAFSACWRRVFTAAETTAPELRWDWTVNRGPSQALSDPRAAYPGDAYVDIVGVDTYDMWPAVMTDSDWAVHYSGPYGLRFWADFADSHGKPLSVPEWGVISGTLEAGHSGGDNPLFVERMFQFFQSLGPNLAYEAYFNAEGSGCGCALNDPTNNPLAAAAYRSAYEPG
ncbi:hypothetical protein JOD57_002807 [Geodermatophilus bullaregiensis]|uniref:glycoside hydrolase family 26 protein n=1 Tax=Geodermatophilus bullaregiensis TaxID=1564160 RepID=UPI00195AB587|nr:glycosyl hydrolase [Geodermatophilus bullaregiensis]MBM7806970.1 hypothetical protein [Geodermatophilus bullaregiensis]